MNTLVALCAVGAEKILGNEIKHLGYKLTSNAPGRVSFIGDDDALFKTDLEYIRYELKKIKEATIVSGVGGSSVVSEFCSKVLNKKNVIK